MTMSAGNYTKNFADLGRYVDLYDLMTGWIAAMATIEGEAAALMDDSEDEAVCLQGFLQVTRSIASSLRSYQSQLASAAKRDLVQEMLRKDLGFVGDSKDVTEILEALAEDMVEAAESVDASAITLNAATFDDQNTGTFAATLASGSQLLTDESFEIACISAGTVGSEVWEVRGEPDKHGTLPTNVTSGAGATVVKSKEDQALLTLTMTPYTAGTGYKISGDAGALLSAWALTGAVKGTNTDVDGRIYLNVVDDGGGFRHVDIYKDAARTSLVGHTATYNTTGAKAIVADGGSGLGGTVTVAIVAGTETDLIVCVGFAVVVGDKAYFTTASDEAGTFVEFFRKELKVAPAVDAVGGETQADTLAQ